MAKKPSEKTPKIPQASKKTRDAISFFNGKKRAVDLIENTGSKNFEPSNYIETFSDKFFNSIEGKGKYVALGITTAIASYVIYWMMNQ